MDETFGNDNASINGGAESPPRLNQLTPASALDLAARTDHYQASLAGELKPEGVLQAILVAQLARHAAGLDFAAAAEGATVRHAAQNPEAVKLFDAAKPFDSPYLAAMSSALVANASRHQARHQRGFYAALRELRETSAKTQPASVTQLCSELFEDEESCTAYLAAWHQTQGWHCPACGSEQRYFLPSRGVFECPCRRQASLREGTVFAHTKMPLLAWFQVIITLLVNKSTSTTELATTVRVVRRGTLRKMRARVRQALASPQAEQYLAGLPGYVDEHLCHVSRGTASAARGGHAPAARPTSTLNSARHKSYVVPPAAD
jgi:transposase-like protein